MESNRINKLKGYIPEKDFERLKYLYNSLQNKNISINRKLVIYLEFKELIEVCKRRASIKAVK